MSGQLPWYVARASGLVGWALLAAATLWGLALSTKIFGKRPRPNWILDLHRMLGALALVFTGVHVSAILADQYVHFGLVDVLVPFASKWRAGAVAWGVVGMYLLVAVELTSLLRARIPKTLWRRVHYARAMDASGLRSGRMGGCSPGSDCFGCACSPVIAPPHGRYDQGFDERAELCV